MSAAAQKPLRGAHVLALLLAFFGAVIAVNATFITLAVGSFPGEDVRRSYLQGLDYNSVLARRRAEAALGWRVTAALRPAADAGALLEIEVRDREGRPLDGLAAAGALRWPASERFDRAVAFDGEGGGRYVAALPDLAPGRWRLRARVETQDAAQSALDFEAELTWRS